MDEIKQVIIVRKDLKLGKGKLAAQVAHASCEAVFLIMDKSRQKWQNWLQQWRIEGQEKVVLKVENGHELIEIYNKARNQDLPAVLVKDAGRTQIPPGTITAVGIGPAPEHEINKITGHLKLL